MMMAFFSWQWAAHTFEFPHRVVCYYLGTCPDEEYDDAGVSTWVATPHRLGKWMLDQQNVLLRFILLSSSLTVLCLFHALEYLLKNTVTVLAVITITGVVVSLTGGSPRIRQQKLV